MTYRERRVSDVQQEAEQATVIARLLKAATRYGLDPASGPLLMVEAAHELEASQARIRELERAAMDVILSDEYGDHHVPKHDALAALFPNIKRGYWP